MSTRRKGSLLTPLAVRVLWLIAVVSAAGAIIAFASGALS